ncbi:MAG: adenylate/guanylate cyclase [Panacagrimonas sp.]|nr:AAA family ATPase [Panacagrimonas sp.]MCC2656366.1 adenylate/guanylate cyclase [Panacagrimonas sp.]
MAKQSRFLTYLFCDLVGSTELTRDHEPEDAFELIVGFQDACRQHIERFQGYVACYMGDGVVGYFGYPVSMESSAEAAIRCALELLRDVQSRAEPLKMRVGIASGWGVLGEVRVGGHVVEVAAVSDAANLAARLESAAAPDEILVSDEVYREVEGLFGFHPPRELELKGFAQTQRAHAVAGYGDFRSPSHRRAERQASALVGRDVQLDVLAQLWERAQGEALGSSVLVRGLAGIGKSTLLRNLRTRARRDAERSITLYASRFEEHTAFYPFRAWLEELLDDQPPDFLQSRLRDLLPIDEAEVAHQALDVLLGRAAQPTWPPKLLRERVCAAFVGVMRGLSRESSLLLLIEDLHWLDPSSAEIVARLQEHCASHALLMVASSRPRPMPGAGTWNLMLELGELSDDEVQSLIGALDTEQRLPPSVRREIALKAEGIPLLLREFTLATLAAGAQGAIAIPDSLLESFGARIDAQTQDLDVIGAAAAIGEAFTPALLAQTLRRTEEETERILLTMRGTDLMVAYNGSQGRVYDFSHALLRDAAYRSLVRKQRTELHRKILAASRAMDPEWMRSQPMQAAHHLQAIESHVEAINVLFDGARLRFAASQFSEAAGLITNAIAILPMVADEQARLGLELQLQTLLGLTLTQIKGFGEPEANQAYTRAWSICGQLQRSGEPEFCAIWGIWAHKIVVSEVALSRTLTENLDRIAADMRREDLALLARTAGVTTSLCTADFAVVPGHLDAVLAAYDPARHAGLALSYSMDPKALSLLFASHALSICGDRERAAWARDEAIAHVQALGYEFLQPYATIFGWGSSLYFGADESVLQTLDAAIVQAERLALPFWVVSGLMWKGVALYHLGRDAEADACLRMGLDTSALIGLSLLVPYLRAVHAAVLARLDRLDAALPMFEQSLAQAHATGETFALAEVHRLYAEALMRTGGAAQRDEARRQLAAGAEIAERQAAKGWMTRLRETLAQWDRVATRSDGIEELGQVQR